MHIVVIGTSNSVMSDNYVSSLKNFHDVTNLSCGRVPIFFHIKTILKNQAILKTADLIIIDHYINDCAYYHQAVDDYNLHTGNFYKILKLLNRPVINIFLPAQAFRSPTGWEHYKYLRELSKVYGFLLFDFNEYGFQREDYEGKVHLNRNISYIIGICLSNMLSGLKVAKQEDDSEVLETPYSVVTAEEIAKDNEMSISSFKNSLLEVNYLKLQKSRRFLVKNGERRQLVSVGYLNEIKAMHNATLHLSERDIHFSTNGDLYCHEVFNNQVWIDGDFYLSSLPAEKPCSLLNSREKSKLMRPAKNSRSLNVCELLFYNGRALPELPGNSKAVELKIQGLTDIVKKCQGVSRKPDISDEEIDAIRNAAIRLEALDLKTSHDLMSIARKYRPQGSLINKKLEQYKEQLGFIDQTIQ